MEFSINHNQFLTARRVELKVAVIIHSAVTDTCRKLWQQPAGLYSDNRF